jgi:IPT/TIG domain
LYDATPMIGYASLGGYAGGVLKLYGGLREPSAIKYWIRIGGDDNGGGFRGAICFVNQPLQMGYDGFQGANKLLENWWEWFGGTVLCNLGSGNATSEAGRYALHMEPRDNLGSNGGGFGQPFFSLHAPQKAAFLPSKSNPAAGGGSPVSTKSIGFGYTVYPLITDVSYTNIGLGGGVLMTIEGAGFSTAGNNEVYLGNNVPCKIVTSEMNRLTCITGATTTGSSLAAQSNVLYPGGTGLLHKVYMRDAMGPVGSDMWTAFHNYRNNMEGYLGGAHKKQAESGPTLPTGATVRK